jgi:Tol biopolymer transport system component
MDRVILGTSPEVEEGVTSSTYYRAGNTGLFISKPGANVMICSDGDLLFDSRSPDFMHVLAKGVDTVPKADNITGLHGSLQINTNVKNPFFERDVSLLVRWNLLTQSSNLHATAYSAAWNVPDTTQSYVKVPSYFAIDYKNLGSPDKTGTVLGKSLSARTTTNTGSLSTTPIQIAGPSDVSGAAVMSGFFGWSPDSSNIVFGTSSHLYTKRLSDSAKTQLTTSAAPYAYMQHYKWYGTGSYLADPSGFLSDRQQLGMTDVWKGNTLLYARQPSAVSDEKFDIYTFNMDTLTETKHTSAVDNEINMGPKWSPDGNKIVWERKTLNAGISYGHDSWGDYTEYFPVSGGYLADLASFVDGATLPLHEIWIMNKNGTGQTQLTESPAGKLSIDLYHNPSQTRPGAVEWHAADKTKPYVSRYGVAPRFSWDGKKIIFSSTRDYQKELLPSEETNEYLAWVWAVDDAVWGRQRLPSIFDDVFDTLSNFDELGGEPWYPEYFCPMTGQFFHEFYAMDIDGTNQTRLTDDNKFSKFTHDSLSPSPVSNTFVYFENKYVKITKDSAYNHRTAIFYFNFEDLDSVGETIEAQQAKQISKLVPSPSGESVAVSDHIAWSPDGTKIAFISEHESFRSHPWGPLYGRATRAIYLLSLNDSQNPIKLFSGADGGILEMGGWSPDGTKLAFFDNTIWKYIDMTQYETSAEDTIDIDFKNGSITSDQIISWSLFAVKGA